MRKTGVSAKMSDVPEALLDGERTYSGADMEALLTRAKFRAATHALDDEETDHASSSDDAEDATSELANDAPGGDGLAAAPAEDDTSSTDEAVAEDDEPEPLEEGHGLSRAVLEAVVEDFVPPSYPLAVELQNLVAVMECTSRSMLPERFRSLDREATVRRVAELKRLIGER